MNVLLTADTVGGVWPFALELADALAERDVCVTLAAVGDPLRPDQEEELRRSRAHAAHTAPFALEWMAEPWHDLERAADWLLELAGEARPDVVHVSSYSHASIDWGAPLVVTAHSCVLSWFDAVHGTAAPSEWDAYRRLVAHGLADADVIVAPTAAMLRAVERLYDPPGPRLVVPNGRRPRVAQPISKEPLVVAAGRVWDEAKNLAAVVRAAQALAWPVVLAGDGSDGTAAPNVTALGRVAREELDGLLARASIFALPARYEPFGLGPLEAAQAGCALVLGAIPSLREVWGDAATYVAPDDDGALVAALGRLIADDALRAELAARAQRRAADYTPARMADGYLAAYALAASLRSVAA